MQTFLQNLCLHVVHICEQQTKFKFFKFSIKVGLYLENRFCINGSLAFWKVDKVPNFVLLYKIEFKFHSLNPTMMFCSFIKVLGLLNYGE